MNYETLLFSVENRVGVVTVNRPDKLNALNAVAKDELRMLFEALKTDPLVDAVVITGAGEKAFVAGTDIRELMALDAASGVAFASRGQALFDLVEQMDKPVIAAVNGYALGGGCELALACHLRLASEKARFGQPEVSLGIIPGYGGTQRLTRLIGKGRALEMILTGVQVDAAEALRIGLVNKVFPPPELMARALAMAQLIVSMGQVAVRAALEAVHAAVLPLPGGLGIEAEQFGRCCGSEDFHEGTRAFLEKRKAAFRNR